MRNNLHQLYRKYFAPIRIPIEDNIPLINLYTYLRIYSPAPTFFTNKFSYTLLE